MGAWQVLRERLASRVDALWQDRTGVARPSVRVELPRPSSGRLAVKWRPRGWKSFHDPRRDGNLLVACARRGASVRVSAQSRGEESPERGQRVMAISIKRLHAWEINLTLFVIINT